MSPWYCGLWEWAQRVLPATPAVQTRLNMWPSMTMYDHIRTSRDQERDWPGMNLETQDRDLLVAAAPKRNIHPSIDVSGVAGVATCNACMSVDARREHGDALMVALYRIGRRSFDVMGKNYDLVNRGD